eukprot:GILJ01005204.1.p1 GENE.GILJ01005204.1~~GILJ01005204.1.p1  ORF type:complete len:571 (-),score=83.85 GILJ01005204.1:234-1946(-)
MSFQVPPFHTPEVIFRQGSEDSVASYQYIRACARDDCRRIDFLYECPNCQQELCADHRGSELHECVGYNLRRANVPICPICQELVMVRRGENANAKMDEHMNKVHSTNSRTSLTIEEVPTEPGTPVEASPPAVDTPPEGYARLTRSTSMKGMMQNTPTPLKRNTSFTRSGMSQDQQFSTGSSSTGKLKRQASAALSDESDPKKFKSATASATTNTTTTTTSNKKTTNQKTATKTKKGDGASDAVIDETKKKKHALDISATNDALRIMLSKPPKPAPKKPSSKQVSKSAEVFMDNAVRQMKDWAQAYADKSLQFQKVGLSAQSQHFLRKMAEESKLPFDLESLLSSLRSVAKSMMMNELEIVVWSLYLDKLGWADTRLSLMESLTMSAFAVKMYLNGDHGMFLPHLNRLIPGFSYRFNQWLTGKDRRLMSIPPLQLNSKFNELLKGCKTESKRIETPVIKDPPKLFKRLTDESRITPPSAVEPSPLEALLADADIRDIFDHVSTDTPTNDNGEKIFMNSLVDPVMDGGNDGLESDLVDETVGKTVSTSLRPKHLRKNDSLIHAILNDIPYR